VPSHLRVRAQGADAPGVIAVEVLLSNGFSRRWENVKQDVDGEVQNDCDVLRGHLRLYCKNKEGLELV
jgi:hypothetical protein